MIWLLTSFLVSVELSLSAYAQKASVSILSEIEEVYKHEDPSEVLGANETVHLLQTSYYWNLYATRCMKSRFGKVLGKSFVRSVEYWGLDTSSHAPKFRKFVMILKLTIHNNGRHQPFLHVERLDKRASSGVACQADNQADIPYSIKVIFLPSSDVGNINRYYR
ncbi:uncharacterized protein LOC144134768 isoform X4 [Amblyomma americanum]